MSNVFRYYIFIYYRNNHKCNTGTIQNTKKTSTKKKIKLNNDYLNQY